MALVDRLYRYPVKGLSPEPLATVTLQAGGTFPFDRAYAIENGPSGFDPVAPRHFPKIAFLMLMRNERLASLSTQFDEATATLTIGRNGETVAEGNLETAEGRRTIERFFDDFSADELRGPAKLLRAPGHSFSDSAVKCVSLINLATVREVEGVVGGPVHPLRFRGNIYVEGLAPWAEFGWVGKRLKAGAIEVEAFSRIDRCAATNVNPDTAARDLAIPRTLLDAFGHSDCGIYLKVLSDGDLRVGDAIGLAS
jgi:uncharacterized protein YcbX